MNFRSREKELRLHFPEYLFDQIVASHGNATGQKQEVRLQSFHDNFSQPRTLVRSNRQKHRITACFPDLYRERITVGVANLRRPRDVLEIDDFVSSGNHRDPWTPIYIQPRSTGGRRQCNCCLIQQNALIQQ